MCGGKISAKDLSQKWKACFLFLPFPLHNLKIIIPSSRWQIFQLWCWSGHGHGFYPPSLLNVFFFISFMCDLLWKAQTCVVLLNVFLAASSNALMLSFLSIYCFYTSFNQHRFPSLDTVYFVFPPRPFCSASPQACYFSSPLLQWISCFSFKMCFTLSLPLVLKLSFFRAMCYFLLQLFLKSVLTFIGFVAVSEH